MKTSKKTTSPYTDYANSVVSGGIVAGQYVRQACERYLQMLDREDIEFRAEEVDKVVAFIGKLRHYKGASARKHFTLSDFQFFCVCAIYGLYKDGKRLVRNVYLEMARKNGKSAFCAALCLYELYASGEPSPEVYLLANSAKQSGILYDMCREYAMSIDPREKYSKYYRDKIKFKPNKGVLQAFAADASKLDGFNPSMFCVDEYHAATTSACYDVMKSGQGQRENPLAIVITTAGFNQTSPCYETRKTCVDILAGVKTDDTTFALIFALDEGDDWADPANFKKTNPNLGITVKEDYLLEQIAAAKNNTSLEASVRTKNFNEWLTTASVWLPTDLLNKHTETVKLSDYRGNCAYMGVDLSAVSDLTALALCIPTGDKFVFKVWYFLPAVALDESPNRELYRKWHRNGYLIITPGNVTDYDAVTRQIVALDKEGITVLQIAYDAWNSTQWAIDATALGLPLQPYSQALGNFNRPTKEFERLLRSGKAIIDNNPITRWCFANVALKADHNDNVKPIKGSGKEGKIDGAIAMIEALGAYLQGDHNDYTIA